MSNISPLRLGVVSYLNMQPLVYGLDQYSTDVLQVCEGPPSRLADWLAAGEIDMGMVPVAAVFEHPEWLVVGRSMIGSRGAVASVLAIGPAPVESWKTLRPDSHSRTSNLLAKVLLSCVYGLAPVMGEPLPAMNWELPAQPEPGEGLIMIGSRALRWRKAWSDGARLDLGELWTNWTGLPAVMAVWAARPGVELGDWPERLESLKHKNMGRLDQIVHRWPFLQNDRLTKSEAIEYLTMNLDYHFDHAARQGLERFKNLAAKLYDR